MWKLIVAFIIFAAAALYLINKKGGDIDMSGEKHSVDTHAPAAEASSAASTPAADASAAK
ncbi:MAG: hypothetical protein ACKOWC_07395 [Limnohabitans sp.]